MNRIKLMRTSFIILVSVLALAIAGLAYAAIATFWSSPASVTINPAPMVVGVYEDAGFTTPVASGTVVAFGPVDQGGTAIKTYYVRNNGVGTVMLDSMVPVLMQISGATVGTVYGSYGGATSLAPGAGAILTLSLFAAPSGSTGAALSAANIVLQAH